MMGFTIITTISPDYAPAMEHFVPSWFANSGADEIVIHRIDEGSWAKNILRRNQIWLDEVCMRGSRSQRLLMLDADCMVLKDLSDGFGSFPISVARWPNPNMGVFFLDTGTNFPLADWLGSVVADVEDELAASEDPESGYGFDQTVWHRRLHEIEPLPLVHKLDENEWNYNRLTLAQWKEDLPRLKDTVRIVHFKHHGQWDHDKLAYVREMFAL